MMLLFFSALSFSTILCISNIKFNISDSVMEIEEKFKADINNEQPYCIVYPHETTNFYNLSYRDPEKSSEIRSIFDNIDCIDWYLDRYKADYSPFVYIMPNESRITMSLSMFPKKSYIQNMFFYDITLLCGRVPSIDNPSDIFINKDFADILLNNNIYENTNNYDQLIGKSLPTKAKVKTESIEIEYKITGVIEKDEKYLKYANIFGDYSIVSEYFSLPNPCSTYVNMYDNQFKNNNLIKTLIKKFKYESNYSSLGVGVRAFPIEYRTYFYNPNTLITKEDAIGARCNEHIDNIFDYYFENQNLMPLIVFATLDVSLVMGLFLYTKSKFIFEKKSNFFAIIGINSIVSFPFGCLISKLFQLLFKRCYSVGNPLTILIYLSIILLFAIISWILIRRDKNENRNN